MEKRKLQIDIIGTSPTNEDYILGVLSFDCRDCRFLISKQDYENLISDGIFIRDGKTKDSAGISNTTNIFSESVE